MGLLFRIIYRSLLGIFCLFVIIVLVALSYIETTLPSVDSIKEMNLAVPLRIFSSDGKLIGQFGEERRTPVTLEQVPQTLINAVLATEDRRFYDHPGVDLRGLLRAGVKVLSNASMKQGGSTITMQVARNYFLTRKKTIIRKVNEILLALKIEKEFTKNQILELYLNKIYFGKRAYGVQAAAEVYYGVPIDQLTLAQMAMLAGLPQAPSSINPLHDPEAALKRRKYVLDHMLAYEFITTTEYKKAIEEPLSSVYHSRHLELEAPYVAEMVRQDLFARYGEAIYTLGYEVYTTINSEQQIAANKALRRALIDYDQRRGYRKTKIHYTLSRKKKVDDVQYEWLAELKTVPASGDFLPAVVTQIHDTDAVVLLQNGKKVTLPWTGLAWTRLRSVREVLALGDVIYVQETAPNTWKMVQIPAVAGAFVSLEADTGAVLSLVGGFDYNISKFNRAAQAKRQLGSSFKPFLYAAALAEGFTLASVINDAPLTYVDPVTRSVWRPHNYTNKFYGPTRLRVSLKKSQNMVPIRLLQAITVKTAIDYIERFGIDRSRLPSFLSLSLGITELTPLEAAAGYCVFANGGYRVSPHLIQTIKDYEGNLIADLSTPPPEPAITPQIAYLVTSALQDAIQSGTGVRAKTLGRTDLAGKTGTTNNFMDAWFSGYNRDIVATAWVGFDENKTLGNKQAGGVVALPMWMYFMESVLKDKPESAPPEPPGIVTVPINPSTGLLAHEGQNAIPEIFTEDTVPTSTSSNEPTPSSTWWSGQGADPAGGSSNSLF